MQAFVYQDQIALDYLLDEEGGVCGKCNESESCIEIDYGETISGLASDIKKVSYIPEMEFQPPGVLMGSVVWRSLVEEGSGFHIRFSSRGYISTLLNTLFY